MKAHPEDPQRTLPADFGNVKPPPDLVLVDIADYIVGHKVSPEAIDAARLCMTDTLACAFEALDYPECARLVGPVVPGTIVPHGARVPGTHHELDPERAAFSFSCMIRWLDYNDTFSGATGSHPSDTLAGILMLADHQSRQRVAQGESPLCMRDVLATMVKAYEIQGGLAAENALGETGLMDHNLLPRTASCAVLTQMMGGTREQIIDAVSNAFIDSSIMAFRHAPNVGSRKNWSVADAISQAMRLSRMVMGGETGYPSVLTARHYGFYETRFSGKPFEFQRPYGEYVVHHCNFKFVAAGMHGQTPAECAFQLHPLVKDRLDDIERIEMRTHHFLMKVMNKAGPLHNASDRDHCAQYVIAVSLLNGKLNAGDYRDEFAADPRIDKLRAKMQLVEDAAYTKDYYDPALRSSNCSLQVFFKDGSSTPKIHVEYPAGHPRRRAGVMPVLRAKLENALARRFPAGQKDAIVRLCDDAPRLYDTPVNEFLTLLVPQTPPS